MGKTNPTCDCPTCGKTLQAKDRYFVGKLQPGFACEPCRFYSSVAAAPAKVASITKQQAAKAARAAKKEAMQMEFVPVPRALWVEALGILGAQHAALQALGLPTALDPSFPQQVKNLQQYVAGAGHLISNI